MAKKGTNNYANYSLVLYDKYDLEHIIGMSTVDKYAYIYHNQDEKESHYHLYIHFVSRRRLNWLNNEKLNYTFSQNVMSERAIDVNQLLQYFLHRNNPEKHQYNKEEIKSNYDYMDVEENEKDDNAEILDCIIAIVEHRSTWSQFLKTHPSMIFSMANLKRTYDILYSEYYNTPTNFCESLIKDTEAKNTIRNSREKNSCQYSVFDKDPLDLFPKKIN